jgi:hypothetical protein
MTLVKCANVPKFPADYIYEVDLRNETCGQYKISNFERLTIIHDKDLPLSACQGVFGFSAKKISPVLNWGRDRIQEGKVRCQ